MRLLDDPTDDDFSICIALSHADEASTTEPSLSLSTSFWQWLWDFSPSILSPSCNVDRLLQLRLGSVDQ